MFKKIIKSAAGLKNYLSFVLTLISILGVLVLAWFKNTPLDMLLPSLLGIYVLGRTSEKASAHWASAKTPESNTDKVIEMISGK